MFNLLGKQIHKQLTGKGAVDVEGAGGGCRDEEAV